MPDFEFTLSVLGYQEDGLEVAHCLEMDLKGRGATAEGALEDLFDLVRMQVSFALQKGEPGLIYRPAEPRFFKAYTMLKKMALQSYPERPRYGGKYLYGDIPIAAIERKLNQSRSWRSAANVA